MKYRFRVQTETETETVQKRMGREVVDTGAYVSVRFAFAFIVQCAPTLRWLD
jgi:hypothetical protein